MSLSTHVLDTGVGRPAPEVPVRLEVRGDAGWEPLAAGRTDADGRLGGWDVPAAGVYRLVFEVGDHLGPDSFYPEVVVVFRVVEPAAGTGDPAELGFGTQKPADEHPALLEPQEAWVCRYWPAEASTADNGDSIYGWKRTDGPERVPARNLHTELFAW